MELEEIDVTSTFLALDYIGTAVFAISGALAAMRHRFDPIGVVVLALVTAVGGGTLRDMMIGRTPVGWMTNTEYVWIILGSVLLAIMFRTKLSYFRRTLFLFDAIGLGIFTITGVELGMAYGLHPVVCMFLGTMSAAFGGVIRDILVNEVPLIFHKEVYASLSFFGGGLLILFNMIHIPSFLSYLIIAGSIVLLRILAVKKEWVVPKFYRQD